MKPRYVLLAVDLYSSKVYVYPMCSRKQILQKLRQFYDDTEDKRNEKTMRLQEDNEFQQVKIKDLNHENNVEIFMSSVSIRFRAKNNMNNVTNKKYGLSPNEIEKKTLSSNKFKTFNFRRIKHTKKPHYRLDRDN